MFNKTNNNSLNLSIPSSEPIIPDPWEPIAPEPHLHSPLELDRLLQQEHPLISAAAVHPAMPSVELPTGLLPPPPDDR